MLSIDPEFASLLRPLSEDERRDLERSCREHGTIRDPIVTWQGKIVDGHNRYEIANEYGLSYTTIELDLDTIDEVREWIIRNQFGRRNNEPNERRRLTSLMDAIVNSDKVEPVKPDVPKGRAERVRQALDLDVSRRTVARDLQAADAIKELPIEARRKIESGQVEASNNAMVRYSQLPEEKKIQVADLIAHSREGATAIDSVNTAIDLVEEHGNDDPERDAKIDKAAANVLSMIGKIARAIDERQNHYKDGSLGYHAKCHSALNELNKQWQDWVKYWDV